MTRIIYAAHGHKDPERLALFTPKKGNAKECSNYRTIALISHMLEECVISLVLTCHSKDLEWRTTVTARLWLRVLFCKQRKVYSRGLRGGWPQRRGLNPSWLPPFYTFVSFLSSDCPMQIELAKKGAFYFTWSSHSSPWVFFCSIFAGFSLSLSFSHHHFWLLFLILTT